MSLVEQIENGLKGIKRTQLLMSLSPHEVNMGRYDSMKERVYGLLSSYTGRQKGRFGKALQHLEKEESGILAGCCYPLR